MQNAAGSNCLYNPRYSDCLKEMLLQSVLFGDESQRLFDRHSCQGPVHDDSSCMSVIDSSHLLAMRSGWDAGAGPYPAFRVQQPAGPLVTQKNLLTVMRARRLGPLRVRAPAPVQQPLVPTPSIEVQTPPDTCLSYRDRKDRQRFAPQTMSVRRSLPILPLTSSVGDIDRDGPIVLRPTPADDELGMSADQPTHVHTRPVDILEPDELSLSFNYNHFRERLARWEAAAEAAVVATSPIASSSELLRLRRRPVPGLQIRSVVVSDRTVAASVPSPGGSRGGGGVGGGSGGAGRGGGGIKSRQFRQVKSNQRR